MHRLAVNNPRLKSKTLQLLLECPIFCGRCCMISIQGSPMKKQNHSFTELDKSIDEFLQKRKEAGQGIQTATEAESIMSVMLGRLLSRMLEGEMTIISATAVAKPKSARTNATATPLSGSSPIRSEKSKSTYQETDKAVFCLATFRSTSAVSSLRLLRQTTWAESTLRLDANGARPGIESSLSLNSRRRFAGLFTRPMPSKA